MEVLTAFEMQAQEFKKVQEEFSDYMDRLQEDIALKAERFGHVEFYDARLQDGYSNSMAVAASEVQNLDERRKPLAMTNPLLAKESVLLPEPSVEEMTYEHLSLNLPSIAVNALDAVSRIAVEDAKQTFKDDGVFEEQNDVHSIPENDEAMMPNIPEDEDVPDIPEDENENEEEDALDIPEDEDDDIPSIPEEEDNNTL